jgi:hypothetical protein
MMPQPRLRVFPGGGRVTIVHRGGSGPTTFEVAWRNPSSAQVKDAQAFWKSVNGHVNSFWFNFDGTRYEPCHFHSDSLKTIPTNHDRSECLVVRFVGRKVAADLALKPVPPRKMPPRAHGLFPLLREARERILRKFGRTPESIPPEQKGE